MSIFENLAAVLVTAIGALFQGIAGLGLNLFASPFLMMIEPKLVPGPILAAALVLTVLMVLRDRSGIDLRGVGWMAAGMVPGSLLGSLLLPIVPLKILAITLGLLVLTGVLISFFGFRFPSHWWVLMLAGFVSGLGGTMVSIGGPPVAVVTQDLEPRILRATLSGYFILAGIVALLVLIPAGRLGIQEIALSGWLIVGTLIGFLVSWLFINRVNKNFTRMALLIVSAVSSVMLIVQQFQG
jgi:uncharacterized membrane protein YfcA